MHHAHGSSCQYCAVTRAAVDAGLAGSDRQTKSPLIWARWAQAASRARPNLPKTKRPHQAAAAGSTAPRPDSRSPGAPWWSAMISAAACGARPIHARRRTLAPPARRKRTGRTHLSYPVHSRHGPRPCLVGSREPETPTRFAPPSLNWSDF